MTNTTNIDPETASLYNEDAHPVDADDLEITEEEYTELVYESLRSEEPEGWVTTSNGVHVYADR